MKADEAPATDMTRPARAGAPAAHATSWRNGDRLRALARRHALPAGLAVGLGALLRLLWPGDTSFLGDQAELLAVGRSAAQHGAVIVTGIPSSLGALNPPVSTWVYGMFAVVGGPVAGAIFTALANIIAVALLYALATRYLGRLAGFAAALLYATASSPVHYSRFIWQQNLLAPVVLLLFWFTLRAVVERKRGWLGWAVACWGVATQLHPTAAPLLGLIAVALAFTWRDLRRRDLAWAALALVILFGPSALWEVVSHGSDLTATLRLGQGHAVFDTTAISYLLQLTFPAPAVWFGAHSSYVGVGHALTALHAFMLLLVACSQAWLVALLVAPWAAERDLRLGLRAALADTNWRLTLCLGLWEALPLLFMLRHSRPVEPHYLLVILPAVYLCMGDFLTWVSAWLGEALARRPTLRPAEARALATATLIAVALIVGAAQTVGVASELLTIHSGAFDGLALPLHYGTPLASERAALAAAQAAAQRLGANVAIASTRVEQEPLGYLNATTAGYRPATDYISDSCVATPAASAQTPLVTLAPPDSAAASLLPGLHGASQIGAVAVQGGAPYLIYAIAPGATLAGERSIASATASSALPQPIAYAYGPAAAPTLNIRWAGAPHIQRDPSQAPAYWYGANPGAAPLADYTFTAQPLDASGQPLGAPLVASCSRLEWSAQLGLITTMRLPMSLTSGAGARQLAGWRVAAQAAPIIIARPTLGPLTLETGGIGDAPAQSLGAPVTFATPGSD